MKAISIKQPWAYLICAGIKDIENRTWACPKRYIGQRVLIHASGDRKLNLTSLTREQYNYACDKIIWDSTTVKPCDMWNRSAIIGSVEIVDCVINHPSIWADKNKVKWVGEKRSLYEEMHGEKLIYNWVLANPILFENPILNVKGRLGFWDYELTEK
jgi:predicted transcriptional regulator